MEVSDLIRIEYHGELVLTSKQMSNLYNCAVYQIRQNFKNKKDKFVEGVHYFYLEGAALREFKEYLAKVKVKNNGVENLCTAQNSGVENFDAAFLPCTKLASSLFLWTKEGVVRHCKMIGTQEAWEVFKLLEKSYFEQNTEQLLNCVYAMELDDGTVKIGRSANIDERSKQIENETGCKVLRIYHTELLPKTTAVKIESDSCKPLNPYLVHGKEYFCVAFDAARAVIEQSAETIHPPKNDFTPREKLDTLKFLIANCTDENLRDELIKTAANILINFNKP